MRLLHAFEPSSAQHAHKLADALLAAGIETDIRQSREGEIELWVLDERVMDVAQETLQAYLNDPQDARFTRARDSAELVRREQAKAERDHAQRVAEAARVHAQIKAQQSRAIGPVTMAIIVLSVALFGIGYLVEPEQQRLLMTDTLVARSGDASRLQLFVASLFYNAVNKPWAFVTAVFVHGGILHIAFNMMWMKDLGTLVERVHSGKMLVLMTLVFGVGGVLGQMIMGGSAIGMSGVIYGIFMYFWVRGKLDPRYPIQLNPTMVMFMLGWYVLCFVLPMNIGNAAHTAGLVLGVLWGGAAGLWSKRAASAR